MIDANGNVYRDNAYAREATDTGEIEVLKQQVATLKNEIEELQSSVAILKMSGKNISTATGAILYQNAPNPFSVSTKIRYYIPETVRNATCVIYDMQGREQRRININERGNGNLDIGDLNTGVYVYSLFIDGKFTDAKKMTIAK